MDGKFEITENEESLLRLSAELIDLDRRTEALAAEVIKLRDTCPQGRDLCYAWAQLGNYEAARRSLAARVELHLDSLKERLGIPRDLL